jgi:prepilin-type N-terminal cleavage/methylation domain-containing protein
MKGITPHPKGFTIIELLIVIVVIGALALITIVAYNGVQQRALVTTLKSDLANASKQMELAQVDTGSYPTAFPSGVKASQNVVLSLSQTANGYCINAESLTSNSIKWSYASANGGFQEGLCSGAVIAGSETGINPNLITNTGFSSGWNLNFQTTTGRSLATRAGTTGDPYPSRPVLTLSNNATASTTWCVLQSSGLNHSAIQTGKVYTRALWARKIGPHAGAFNLYGVLAPGGTNISLNTTGFMTPSDTWQYVSGTATAVSNSDSSKVLYLPLNCNAFTTSGWSLEFQGFELREQ